MSLAPFSKSYTPMGQYFQSDDQVKLTTKQPTDVADVWNLVFMQKESSSYSFCFEQEGSDLGSPTP